jgi:hypothetical protein
VIQELKLALTLRGVDARSTSRPGGLVDGGVVRAAVTIGYTFLVSVRASRHQRCSRRSDPSFQHPLNGDMGATR